MGRPPDYGLLAMGDGSIDDNGDNLRGNQLPAPLKRKITLHHTTQYYTADGYGTRRWRYWRLAMGERRYIGKRGNGLVLFKSKS